MEGITHHVGEFDSGDGNTHASIGNEDAKFADHALVIMYRPFNDDWVQTIAVFSAKNAMPGDSLSKKNPRSYRVA